MAKLIEWSDELAICETIDNQHKQLINLINDLYSAFTQSKAKEVIANIIQKLLDYTHYHFQTEEELFEKYNYPFAQEHIQDHNHLRQKVEEFINRYNQEDQTLIYDVMTELTQWLYNHILIQDKKYADYICK